MKKRSLFAAVAMLIVSALVLTSSTYAWFSSTGQTASVTKSAVGIQRSDSTRLEVADANGTSWSGSYTPGNGTGNLVPTDINPALANLGELTCTYDGVAFSNIQAPSSTNVYTYQWRVRAVSGYAGKKITIPYTFTTGTGTGTGCIFGAVKVGSGDWVVCGPQSSYNYLNTVTAATESTVNGIVDLGEFDSAQALTTVNNIDTTGSGTLEIAVADVAAGATGTRMGTLITVMLWAEGQAPGCAGSADWSGAGFVFDGIALANA